MPRPSLVRDLKQRCTDYRAALLDAGIIPADELSAIWPGGADNPRRDGNAWLYTHWNLARFFARQEARQEYTDGAHPGRSDALIALQAGVPRAVPLQVPVEIDGVSTHVLHLHYKSFVALRRLASYARVATQLLGYVREIEDAPEHIGLALEAHAWRERVLLLLIWGATHERAGLPWDAVREPWPALPSWVAALSADDVLAIQLAYVEQYGRALMAIGPFLNSDESDRDPLSGWETFFASYATEKGLDAQLLLQDRGFLPFLTQVSLAAHSARVARDAAKAQADAGAPA